VCTGSPAACQAPTCADANKNGAETDVDCGGTSCPQCGTNRNCIENADCVSGNCVGGKCQGTPINCSAGLAFCDDFEDGNDNGWTKSSNSAWSIQTDGTMVYRGTASEEAWAGLTSWTDQTVEAQVKVMNFGGTSDSYRAGIMARRSSSSNFYALQVRSDGSLSIRKSTSVLSGCAQVASGVNVKDWFSMKLEVTGPPTSVTLKGYINGSLKLTCTHTSGLGSGTAGFVTYGSGTSAHFDDITVIAP
jgi:pectate lyase